MFLLPGIDQFKVASKNSSQRGCIMTHDRKTTASLRTIWSERSNHDVADGVHCFFQTFDVCALVKSFD